MKFCIRLAWISVLFILCVYWFSLDKFLLEELALVVPVSLSEDNFSARTYALQSNCSSLVCM